MCVAVQLNGHVSSIDVRLNPRFQKRLFDHTLTVHTIRRGQEKQQQALLSTRDLGRLAQIAVPDDGRRIRPPSDGGIKVCKTTEKTIRRTTRRSLRALSWPKRPWISRAQGKDCRCSLREQNVLIAERSATNQSQVDYQIAPTSLRISTAVMAETVPAIIITGRSDGINQAVSVWNG